MRYVSEFDPRKRQWFIRDTHTRTQLPYGYASKHACNKACDKMNGKILQEAYERKKNGG